MRWILLLKKPSHRGDFLAVIGWSFRITRLRLSCALSNEGWLTFHHAQNRHRSIDVNTDGQIHNLSDSNQYDHVNLWKTILAPSSLGLRCCPYLFPSLLFQLSVFALFPIMKTHSALSHSFFCSLNNLYIQVSPLPPFLFFPPHLSLSTSPSVPSQ